MARAHSRSRSTTPRGGGGDLAREVEGLSELDSTTLKQRWVKRVGGPTPPSGLDRRLLIRALAYRLQERVLGGLKPATRRLLLQVSEHATAERPAQPSNPVRSGTILVRQWHGTSHRVTVFADGCSWRGRRYRSLSAVARAITGTHWSGPRFFGLVRARERKDSHGTRAA